MRANNQQRAMTMTTIKQMTEILSTEDLGEKERTKRALDLAGQLSTDELWEAVQWFISQEFDPSEFNTTRHIVQVAVIHTHARRYTGLFI